MVYKNYSTLISGEVDNGHGLQCPYKPMKIKTSAMEENQRRTRMSPLWMSLLLHPRKERGAWNCDMRRTCKISLTLQYVFCDSTNPLNIQRSIKVNISPQASDASLVFLILIMWCFIQSMYTIDSLPGLVKKYIKIFSWYILTKNLGKRASKVSVLWTV